MIVRTLPARAGLMWLRDALRLYRRQPFALTSLVILYTIGISLLVYVPFIGLPLAAVLIPFGTIGLTLAGRDAERGTMPMPTLMLEPFRHAEQRRKLAQLGFVNATLWLLLVVVVSVLAADELAHWQFVDGQVDRVSVGQNLPWDAIVAASLIYLPILMATWLAPQLVAWHGQPVGKALFFSFFACWRNRWPFLTLGAALLVTSIVAVFILPQLLQGLGASPQLASMLVAPVALILVSVGYATQYPIYRSLIETQDALA